MVMLVQEFKRKIRKELLKHELSVLRYFNRNPYNCPKCDRKMKFAFEIT